MKEKVLQILLVEAPLTRELRLFTKNPNAELSAAIRQALGEAPKREEPDVYDLASN